MNLDSGRYNASPTTYLDLCLLHPTDISDTRKGKGIKTDRAHEASGSRGIRKKWDTLGHCHRDIRRVSRGDSGDGGAADGGRREGGGARDGGEGADKGHGDWERVQGMEWRKRLGRRILGLRMSLPSLRTVAGFQMYSSASKVVWRFLSRGRILVSRTPQAPRSVLV
jgi:hypothetical protein